MPAKRIDLPKLVNHTCFVCGTANPIGLNLHFYYEDNGICTDISLGQYYAGWENMIHGGIITALLDETMAWAVIYFKRSFFVTRKIEVTYLNPVLIDTPLHVKAGLMHEHEKKDHFIRGTAELSGQQGEILAKARGEFVLLTKEKMAFVPEDRKKEMIALFEKLPPLRNSA
jgi:acyl-CoA thioesterase FadM